MSLRAASVDWLTADVSLGMEIRMSDKFFGSHEIQSREEVVKSSSDRSFGIVFAVFFVLVTAISWYNDGKHWLWWLGGAALFSLVALVWPSLLAPLNRVWMKFGLLLAAIISPVVRRCAGWPRSIAPRS